MAHTHICIALRSVERALIDNTYDDLCLMVDDRPATRSELLAAFNDATAKGYDVLPPCDNVTKTGHCAGHPD